MPEEDIYTNEGSEELLEGDEISNVEEGFAQGYGQGNSEVKCGNCNKLLTDEQIVEREFRGQTFFFCSISCAETYVRKLREV